MNNSFDSLQFNHPLIVSTYDTNNPIDDYGDFFLNFANDIDAKTIIDVGCGTGLLTCRLAEMGFNMIGVEPASPMLEIAKKNCCSSKVKWIHGLAKDLSNDEADIVIMTGHVAQFHLTDEDWSDALDGIFRSLRIGGFMIFESRNPSVHFWKPGKAQASWQSSKENPNITSDKVYGEIRSWIEFVNFENNKLEYKIYYSFLEQNEIVVSHDILKFRTQKELSKSLQKKGFTIKNVYGFWSKIPVEKDSPELIFVAQKK